MRKVSIVIPSWNKAELLAHCVSAIRQHTPIPYEIIVVDNGSTDGTSEYCRQQKLIFISLPDNKGFPAACNAGMKAATGDGVLLLNNDVIVTAHWLQNMIRCMESDPGIGLVGPVTNFCSGIQMLNPPPTSLAMMDEWAQDGNRSDKRKWLPVKRLVGFCLLIRTEMMDKIGWLDERFSPGHYEDDDYCYRARMAGYRLMSAGDTFVWHIGSASFGQGDPAGWNELIHRNRQRFVDKWAVDPHTFIGAQQ